MTEYDIVVRDGTIVTAGSTGKADIGIRDELIAQIGGEMSGRIEVDARDKLVLPGGVDMHVHLSAWEPLEAGEEMWVDDFYTGSLAAIAGGITTVGNMTFQWPGETMDASLARDHDSAARHVAVDYVLHPVLGSPTPDSLEEIKDLASRGYASLKIFLSEPEFEAHPDAYLEAMRQAGANGMLTLLHCEDGVVIRCLCRKLLSASRGAQSFWAESRPDYSEQVATERAIAFARATGSPIYIVHLSSRAALDVCRRARAEGLTVYVETRPLYLYLTQEVLKRPDGAKFIGAPPLRSAGDVEALWNGLSDGTIQCVCTDHAPWSLRQKLDPLLDVTSARAGVAELETALPMLYSEGVRRGRITLERFVELVATNPARLFGLYPRKGTIAIGSDADIVVWDPTLRRQIDGATMHSEAGYSVYDGREVQGWPAVTISRGEIVFEEGRVTARAGRGQWIPRVGAE
jgi:dihydropyrimidinase